MNAFESSEVVRETKEHKLNEAVQTKRLLDTEASEISRSACASSNARVQWRKDRSRNAGDDNDVNDVLISAYAREMG